MQLTENIREILMREYPLSELLDLLSGVALSPKETSSLQEAYDLIMLDESEESLCDASLFPSGVIVNEAGIETTPTQVDFGLTSPLLAEILSDFVEEGSGPSEGFRRFADLGISVSAPKEDEQNPFVSEQADSTDNDNALSIEYDSKRGVWVRIWVDIWALPGEGFEEVVEAAYQQLVQTKESEGAAEEE